MFRNSNSQWSRRFFGTAGGAGHAGSAGITLEHVVARHQVDGAMGICSYDAINDRHEVRTGQWMDLGERFLEHAGGHRFVDTCR